MAWQCTPVRQNAAGGAGRPEQIDRRRKGPTLSLAAHQPALKYADATHSNPIRPFVPLHLSSPLPLSTTHANIMTRFFAVLSFAALAAAVAVAPSPTAPAIELEARIDSACAITCTLRECAC
jgi:hypothetical protein